MPFAPTVLQDSVDHLFEHHVRSPFMSFAVPAAESAGYNLRAVLSHDGTARLQTVASSDSSFIARVLVWFHRLTGVPCVLNTSFNRGGEPIVETPYHALETFMESPVNTLVLDSYMIVKSVDRELVDAHLLPESFGMPILMVGVGVDNPIDLRQRTVVQTIRRIGAIGQVVCIRSTLPLFDEYVRLLRKGSKLTTIRYVKGGIELPATEVLPLVGTPDFGKHRAPVDSNVSVRIGQVVYKKFGELDEHDATRDGFQSLAQLKGVLGESIYPGILDNQFVTIYSIQMVGQL